MATKTKQALKFIFKYVLASWVWDARTDARSLKDRLDEINGGLDKANAQAALAAVNDLIKEAQAMHRELERVCFVNPKSNRS